MSLPPDEQPSSSELATRVETHPPVPANPRPRPAIKTSAGPVRPELQRRAVVKGSRPGGDYVRVQLPYAHEFRPRAGGVLEATEEALLPKGTGARFGARVKRVVIGDRLATAEQIHERLTKVKALAVLSSDAISSVAYATEASLGVLVVAGVGTMRYNLIIAVCHRPADDRRRRLLPPDHPRLPARRRLLHRRARQPGRPARPDRRRRAADRLRADRRRQSSPRAWTRSSSA